MTNIEEHPIFKTTSDLQNCISIYYGIRANSQSRKLEHINLWDVSQITDMTDLFKYVPNFNEDISSWNVSNVTIMEGMFKGAINFNQPLNEWNVSKVTNMDCMFKGATSFNQPLNDWDVSNVQNMRSMFENATSFNQPLNEWNVSNVNFMPNMFKGATSFNQSLNDWVLFEWGLRNNRKQIIAVFSSFDEDNLPNSLRIQKLPLPYPDADFAINPVNHVGYDTMTIDDINLEECCFLSK